ncbi:MAG: calcium/proton exchanger [Beijerinckiaceae bacterium]|nr:calcium/proton exchanger [Beijerinckiaceae bacterium]
MAFSLDPLKWPLMLLALTPVAPILKYVIGAPSGLIFATGCVGIMVLAEWIRRATDHLANTAGSTIGGLLNVTFGSIAEFILALFVLSEGHVGVVRAQIVGSIIGTGLFGLGLAIIVGSIGRSQLSFNRDKAGLLASLLILVLIALALPAVFDQSAQAIGSDARARIDEELSIGVAVILLGLYAANLIYTLVTHRDVFGTGETDQPGEGWSLAASLGVLVIATIAVAGEAEIVSSALESTARSAGISEVFIGVVALALIGTSSDILAAAWFAKDGRMNLVINLCIGSAIQIALVVAPLLVIASALIGHPLTLIFGNPLHLFSIGATAFIVNAIAIDGEATWFEGVLLVAIYVMLGWHFS